MPLRATVVFAGRSGAHEFENWACMNPFWMEDTKASDISQAIIPPKINIASSGVPKLSAARHGLGRSMFLRAGGKRSNRAMAFQIATVVPFWRGVI